MEKAIENLKILLSQKAPNSTVAVDPPDRADGNWWIDVRAGKRRVTLEYRPARGFGIFYENAGYGEGPAEVYRTAELAVRRVAQVINAGKRERVRLTLKDLRELYDCSQISLAEKIGVKQSAISRLERRSEVKLGTLAAAVHALGGELEVRAHFSDADVPISVKD
jgi:DNA-binding XRE family transcriptional regulator